jgi:hypothetical protein
MFTPIFVRVQLVQKVLGDTYTDMIHKLIYNVEGFYPLRFPP